MQTVLLHLRLLGYLIQSRFDLQSRFHKFFRTFVRVLDQNGLKSNGNNILDPFAA